MTSDLSKIKEIFVKEKLPLLLGFSQGANCYNTLPRLFRGVSELDGLTFNLFSNHNLATYVLDALNEAAVIGILVKPCDGKTIVELIRENKVPREKLVIFSLPCRGIIDIGKLFSLKEKETEFITDIGLSGESVRIEFDTRVADAGLSLLLENKCLKCSLKQSPVCDYVVGEAAALADKDYADVQIGKTEKEKRSFWVKEYSRCIRCSACRNVCPMCYCTKCVLEGSPDVLRKESGARENGEFLMIRAMHLAGRCVGCGRCSQVCPVSIYHEALHEPVSKYILKAFDFEAGKDTGRLPLLSEAKIEEKEDFSDE